MSESGIIAATIGGIFMLLAAAIALWRFRRKDRADAEAVEEGTISGRFKDADALMKHIDDRVEKRVEERVAELRTEVEDLKSELVDVKTKLGAVQTESHEMYDAFREWITRLWLWDQRGRIGQMPAMPSQILNRLGLLHLVAEPDDTQPTV